MSIVLLDHNLRPDWSELDPVRETVAALVDDHVIDVELQQGIVMAVSELCENVIKYAKNQSGGQLVLSLDKENALLVAETTNQSTEKDVAVLQEELVGLETPYNAEREYHLRMLATMLDDHHSRLGLIRIVHEAYAHLSCHWDPPMLTMRAEFPLHLAQLKAAEPASQR